MGSTTPIRPEPRFREHIPCHVVVAGSSYQGTVRNLSWSGLFVETEGRPEPGSQIWVELRPEAQRPHRSSIRVSTRVVWMRCEATGGADEDSGGVGLRIQNASESYYDFLLRVAARPSDG